MQDAANALAKVASPRALFVNVLPPMVTLPGQVVSVVLFIWAWENRASADTIPNVRPGG